MMKRYEEKKYYIPGFYYITTFMTAFVSSAITLIFTYPFDNAYARATTNLNPDKKYIKLQDCFSTSPQSSIVTRYYSGFNFAIVQSIAQSTLTFFGYQLINDKLYKIDKKTFSYVNLFGMTSLVALLASSLSYPIDTIKRKYQIQSMFNANPPLDILRGNYYR
jgi:hypothetical protein